MKQKEVGLGVRIQVVTKEISDVEKLDKPRGASSCKCSRKIAHQIKQVIKAGDIILEFNGILD